MILAKYAEARFRRRGQQPASLGPVAQRRQCPANGNLIAEQGDTDNDYLYTGQSFDRDDGLYYMRERYYDPASGRFLGLDPVQGDPLRPLSLHRYLYAGNDPIDFADPNGDFFTLLGFSFGELVQGGIRGLTFGKNLSSVCRIKGLAKVVPLAISLRQALANKSALAESVIEALSPSVSFGTIAKPGVSVGLAQKIPIYEHPLKDQNRSHLA